jgi:hypothetical protein
LAKTLKRGGPEIGFLFSQTPPLKSVPKRALGLSTIVSATNPLCKSSKTRTWPAVIITLSPGNLKKRLFSAVAVATGSLTTVTQKIKKTLKKWRQNVTPSATPPTYQKFSSSPVIAHLVYSINLRSVWAKKTASLFYKLPQFSPKKTCCPTCLGVSVVENP